MAPNDTCPAWAPRHACVAGLRPLLPAHARRRAQRFAPVMLRSFASPMPCSPCSCWLLDMCRMSLVLIPTSGGSRAVVAGSTRDAAGPWCPLQEMALSALYRRWSGPSVPSVLGGAVALECLGTRTPARSFVPDQKAAPPGQRLPTRLSQRAGRRQHDCKLLLSHTALSTKSLSALQGLACRDTSLGFRVYMWVSFKNVLMPFIGSCRGWF